MAAPPPLPPFSSQVLWDFTADRPVIGWDGKMAELTWVDLGEDEELSTESKLELVSPDELDAPDSGTCGGCVINV